MTNTSNRGREKRDNGKEEGIKKNSCSLTLCFLSRKLIIRRMAFLYCPTLFNNAARLYAKIAESLIQWVINWVRRWNTCVCMARQRKGEERGWKKEAERETNKDEEEVRLAFLRVCITQIVAHLQNRRQVSLCTTILKKSLSTWEKGSVRGSEKGIWEESVIKGCKKGCKVRSYTCASDSGRKENTGDLNLQCWQTR